MDKAENYGRFRWSRCSDDPKDSGERQGSYPWKAVRLGNLLSPGRRRVLTVMSTIDILAHENRCRPGLSPAYRHHGILTALIE
jgi:hypothetical protein